MKGWLVLVALLIIVSPAWAVKYPTLSGFVTDGADMISPEWEAKINALAREIEENTTAEFAVVTVESLEGLTREQYAVELFFDPRCVPIDDIYFDTRFLVVPFIAKIPELQVQIRPRCAQFLHDSNSIAQRNH